MSDRKTSWVCKVDDQHTVRLEDIPARQLVDLETSLETSWLVLVGAPLQKVPMALAMYERCCALAGVEPRDVTSGELVEMFELVDDDRPMSYSGGLPDPKADDRTTVG
jgi:hypothetical protein